MKSSKRELAPEGVAFLLNTIGTRKWDQVDPQSLVEWLSDMEELPVVKDWMANVSHGQTYKVGKTMIVALRVICEPVALLE